MNDRDLEHPAITRCLRDGEPYSVSTEDENELSADDYAELEVNERTKI